MTYDAKVVQVMIASPGDVEKERQIIRNTIHEWNAIHSKQTKSVLLPIGWDTHASPSMGGRPQAIINEQILIDSDLLIAVFWTRLGSPTGKAASGTVEEIEEHIDSGKPAMIYFSTAPVRLESVDPEQYEALQSFKNAYKDKGLIETYDSLSNFKDIFTRQLAQSVIRNFIDRTEHAVDSASHDNELNTHPNLSNEAIRLLVSGADDKHGSIIRIRHMAGTDVQAGGVKLLDNGDARSAALWESAINELIDNWFIEDRTGSGEVYAVTYTGYQLADHLATQGPR